MKYQTLLKKMPILFTIATIGKASHIWVLDLVLILSMVFITLLQSGMLAFEIDHLSKADRINEYILTALRTIWGIDTKWLEKQYNFNLLLLHSENLKSFKEQGMIQIEEGMITLSDKGKLLADYIASKLFI